MRNYHRGRPPEGRPLTPMMLINDISKSFHDQMRQETERCGFKSGYRQIMFHLAREAEGCTQLELCRMTRLKAPTVSVALRSMEQDGIVVRRTDEEDLRAVRVYLTDKGRRLDNAVHGKILYLEQTVVQGLTSEQKAVVLEALHIMRDNILRAEEETEG